MKRLVLLMFIAFYVLGVNAQESKLWKEYKNAYENGTEAKLPNFSYAGYKYSEVAIPKAKHKVFNVVKFGADPKGVKSSKTALRKAIAAAEKHGSGIILFPKGRYLINTKGDDLKPILIKGSNIVFRGEGNNVDGSVLFFEKDPPPLDPNKKWTVPRMLQVKSNDGDQFLTDVVADTRRETFTITVKNAKGMKPGDWVILKVLNNSKDLLRYDLQPIVPEKEWKSILTKGVQFNERHQVKAIDGNKVTFFEPIHYDVQAKHGWKLYSFGHVENVGFENIMFEGNWTIPFVHHKNAQHDSGWSILSMGRAVNSWVKDCRFKNISSAVSFSQSAYCTALNNVVEGNLGHNAISAGGGSTGILIAKTEDKAGQWHACGVGGGSTTGTVLWRCKHPKHTSFETHASQPRCTLFDKVEGGFFLGRGGGARQNLPNHGRYLVLWNYKETDEAEKDFEFWSRRTWYWKIVPPIVVGFHGAGTTFKESDVDVVESLGTPVKTESLWEAQLTLRLGKLPRWIEAYK
ncbi:DUF4955 domain-containing protein [Puteibacter caeruleilacunae]|nr:DUF4955 domain-containing protein [Puteibacter caeruleilacunae]